VTAVMSVVACLISATIGGSIGFLIAACLAVGKHGDSDKPDKR